MDVHLKVRGLRRVVDSRVILADISFDLHTKDILFIQGPSGVGKTLLLRALACLDPIQDGTLKFNGERPQDIGLPSWRAQITYVSQSRVDLKGTPAELYFNAQKFAAQKGRRRGDLPAIVFQLGLEQVVLNQPWSELSGGQAQRAALAIAIALSPAILLLDEPSSHCDEDSVRRIEEVVKGCDSSVIWVTHDTEQPKRVGGRILHLPFGTHSTVEAALSEPDTDSVTTISNITSPTAPRQLTVLPDIKKQSQGEPLTK